MLLNYFNLKDTTAYIKHLKKIILFSSKNVLIDLKKDVRLNRMSFR